MPAFSQAAESGGIDFEEVFAACRALSPSPQRPNDLRAVLLASGIRDIDELPIPAVGCNRPTTDARPGSAAVGEGTHLRLLSLGEEANPARTEPRTKQRRFVVVELSGGPAALAELQRLLERWPRLPSAVREALGTLAAAAAMGGE